MSVREAITAEIRWLIEEQIKTLSERQTMEKTAEFQLREKQIRELFDRLRNHGSFHAEAESECGQAAETEKVKAH